VRALGALAVGSHRTNDGGGIVVAWHAAKWFVRGGRAGGRFLGCARASVATLFRLVCQATWQMRRRVAPRRCYRGPGRCRGCCLGTCLSSCTVLCGWVRANGGCHLSGCCHPHVLLIGDRVVLSFICSSLHHVCPSSPRPSSLPVVDRHRLCLRPMDPTIPYSRRSLAVVSVRGNVPMRALVRWSATSRKWTFRLGLLSRPNLEPGQMVRPRRPETSERARGLLSRFFKAFCLRPFAAFCGLLAALLSRLETRAGT
jgi:hypothetical protein